MKYRKASIAAIVVSVCIVLGSFAVFVAEKSNKSENTGGLTKTGSETDKDIDIAAGEVIEDGSGLMLGIELPAFKEEVVETLENAGMEVLYKYDKESVYGDGVVDLIKEGAQEGTVEIRVSSNGKPGIPDVIGMEGAIARAKLGEAGLTPVLCEIYDDEVPFGSVVKLDDGCEPYKAFDEGAEIHYYVSMGSLDTQIEVPQLYRMSGAEAIEALKEAGLDYELYGSKEGIVISQTKKAGEYADKGTAIGITTHDYEPEYEGLITTVPAEAPNEWEFIPDVGFTLDIPMPHGMKGDYYFEIYENEEKRYTKYLVNCEDYGGEIISFFISGEGKEDFKVYVASYSRAPDNYILYAEYIVDYDNGTIKQKGELDEKALLEL